LFGGNNMKKFILSLAFFSLPLVASASATLYISPSQGTNAVGDTFSALVMLDTGGASVNAGEAVINFDTRHVQVISLGYTQSVFSLWTEQPSYSNSDGTITFSGGIPSPGFSGKGAVLRIAFKAKASGQAPIDFLSASVLANDGQGSNIADTLKGALFTVVPAGSQNIQNTSVPAETQSVSVEATTTGASTQPIPVPVITQWSKQLQTGDILVIEGLGLPMSKIGIVIQKDSAEPVNTYTFSSPDGTFTYTYPIQLEKGTYTVSVRNIDSSGAQGDLSAPVSVAVSSPNFIQVGSIAVSYSSIIVILLSLLILVLVVFLVSWRKWRKWMNRQYWGMSEAEKAVHKSFDTLREDVVAYIGHLVESKHVTVRKEKKTKEELNREIKSIEGKIEKEIDNNMI